MRRCGRCIRRTSGCLASAPATYKTIVSWIAYYDHRPNGPFLFVTLVTRPGVPSSGLAGKIEAPPISGGLHSVTLEDSRRYACRCGLVTQTYGPFSPNHYRAPLPVVGSSAALDLRPYRDGPPLPSSPVINRGGENRTHPSGSAPLAGDGFH